MKTVLKIAMIEIRKKTLFTLLTFIVCLLAMYMVVSSITTVTSSAYQKKIFEDNLGCDMTKVLHLNYQKNEETAEFVDVLAQYKDYIARLPGVQSVGQFDATGMYFSELKSSKEYRSVNEEIVKGGRYADHTDITQLLRVDENLLSLMKGGISEYPETSTGNLPIYASAVFQDVLTTGTLLTDEQTNEVYEVAGYFEKGSKWVDENDLIRKLDENEYDIDGSIKLDDLNDVLGTKLASEDYDSLAGFVIQIMDKLPGEGEETDYENIHFKVGTVNRNRIERVFLTITPIENDEQETAIEETDEKIASEEE